MEEEYKYGAQIGAMKFLKKKIGRMNLMFQLDLKSIKFLLIAQNIIIKNTKHDIGSDLWTDYLIN